MRYLIPEVIQTSGMDCGPAALKSIMDGLGVPVNYGRLREACHTDVDGTSINTIEALAKDLGMIAEQIMIPVDHVFLKSANVLPAIAVVQLPNRSTHFVVLWRRQGQFIQIMDPAVGRSWIHIDNLRERLYAHKMAVPAAAWRGWAGSSDFTDPLRERMRQMKIQSSAAESLIAAASVDNGWQAIAALDAATRTTMALAKARGVSKGKDAENLLKALFEENLSHRKAVAAQDWSVEAVDPDSSDSALQMTGAVVVKVRVPDDGEPVVAPTSDDDLQRVLNEPETRAYAGLFRSLKQLGLLTPIVLIVAIISSAIFVMVEALLLRGLMEISQELHLTGQRIGGIAALLIFILVTALLCFFLKSIVLRAGRSIEMLIRVAFLEKIPKLNDRYFQSRLISDMAERAQSLHSLSQFSLLFENVVGLFFRLLFTFLGIIWLDSSSAPLALTITLSSVILPLFFCFFLYDRDMKVRTHEGALGRFYLDALLGCLAIKSHSAQRPMATEHEGLTVSWAQAAAGFHKFSILGEGVQLLVGFGLSAWLVMNHVHQSAGAGSVLLLAYWTLSLPTLGQQLAASLRQVPEIRSRTLRVLEPLSAPEIQSPISEDHSNDRAPGAGVDISFTDISVKASGVTILNDINLAIKAGEHVAIIGPSGSGKSTLVGMLLGWFKPHQGQLSVDGVPHSDANVARIRRHLTWVDPTVQVWNQSFYSNICYGTTDSDRANGMSYALEKTDLQDLIGELPEGMQTPLGEGGRLLSGGEGQRVRLARALLREDSRLVILDEAFRGLQRSSREAMLGCFRQKFESATLLHVTHDIAEALQFDRVIIVENGCISEQGTPQSLLAVENSRLSHFYAADTKLQSDLWHADRWQNYMLRDGRLRTPSDLNTDVC